MYSWLVSCRFCRSCIATSLKNNKWTCPYCRAYLPSEGVPATDVAKRMKSEFQNCTECDTLVRDPAFVHVTGLDLWENGDGSHSFHLCLWPHATLTFQSLISQPLLFLSPNFICMGCRTTVTWHLIFQTHTFAYHLHFLSPHYSMTLYYLASIPAMQLQPTQRIALFANPVAHFHICHSGLCSIYLC